MMGFPRIVIVKDKVPIAVDQAMHFGHSRAATKPLTHIIISTNPNTDRAMVHARSLVISGTSDFKISVPHVEPIK